MSDHDTDDADPSPEPDPAAVDPNRGVAAPKRARPGRQKVFRATAVVGLVLIVIGGLAGWTMLRDDSIVERPAGDDARRSPEQTLTAFHEAQSDGDCDRLIDLVTEDSWSAGGQRSRDHFLEECADAVEGYEPAVDETTVELVLGEGSSAADADEARVDIVSSALPYQPRDHEGRLVVEDGRWRVVTDPYVLHIGRSPAETVAAYVGAYNAGDCERIVDLSRGGWSDSERDQQQYSDDCAQAVERRAQLAQAPLAVEVSSEPVISDDSATVDLYSTVGSDVPDNPVRERARFQLDDLEWRLIRSDEQDGPRSSDTLLAVELVELHARLLPELTAAGGPCPDASDEGAYLYADGPLAPGDYETTPGVRRQFGWTGVPCNLAITLLWVGDEEEALRIAERQAHDILHDRQDLRPDELAEGDTPNQTAAVPGSPEALGVQTSCHASSGGCNFVALMAHGDVVVQVEHGDWPADPALVGQVLRAQVEAL